MIRHQDDPVLKPDTVKYLAVGASGPERFSALLLAALLQDQVVEKGRHTVLINHTAVGTKLTHRALVQFDCKRVTYRQVLVFNKLKEDPAMSKLLVRVHTTGRTNGPHGPFTMSHS